MSIGRNCGTPSKQEQISSIELITDSTTVKDEECQDISWMQEYIQNTGSKSAKNYEADIPIFLWNGQFLFNRSLDNENHESAKLFDWLLNGELENKSLMNKSLT